EISDYQRAIRSELPPVCAETLAGLTKQLGVDQANLEETVANYNASCVGNSAIFDATRCDGLSASNDLHPPKSNWARAIEVPPFSVTHWLERLHIHLVVLQLTSTPGS